MHSSKGLQDVSGEWGLTPAARALLCMLHEQTYFSLHRHSACMRCLQSHAMVCILTAQCTTQAKHMLMHKDWSECAGTCRHLSTAAANLMCVCGCVCDGVGDETCEGNRQDEDEGQLPDILGRSG